MEQCTCRMQPSNSLGCIKYIQRLIIEEDACELVTGSWDSALQCYRLLSGHVGPVDARMETVLLSARADYLYAQQSYETQTWLTAHVRAVLWTKSRPTDRLPVHLHPTAALALNDRCIPDTRQHVIALQGEAIPATEKNKLLHLLGKGLPRRCQIRELSRFLGNYLREGPGTECAIAISRMFMCTLVGLYPHCKCQSSIELASVLISSIVLDPASSTETFATWLRGDCPAQSQHNQSLSLCVIREHLCAVVLSMPDLANLLRKKYNWVQFEWETLSACEYIRSRLFECAAETSGPGSQLRVRAALNRLNSELASVLQKLKQSAVVAPSTRSGNISTDRFLSMLSRGVSGLRATQINMSQTTVYRNIVCLQEHATKTCQAVPATERGVLQRLRYLQAPETFLQQTNALLADCHRGSSAPIVKAKLLSLLEMDVYFYTLLEYELRSAAGQLGTCVYTLPQTHLTNQTVALERAWRDVAELNVYPHNGCLFVCMSCQTIANTVSEPPTDTRRRAHVPNIASLKVAVDDDASALMCARGHNGGGQSTRAHKLLKTELGNACSDVLSSIHGEQGAGKINPATFDSVSAALQCNSVPLVVIPLCGNLVVHGNGMYKLCDSCARVMRVCDQFRNTCFWCLKSQQESALSTVCCVVCSKGVSPNSNDAWLFSAEFDDHVVSRRPVCTACFSLCNGQGRGVLDPVEMRRLQTAKQLRKELRVCSTRGFSRLSGQ